MRWATLSLIAYMIGILIFLTVADFTKVYWVNIYYIWDKLKDLLLLATVYDLLPKMRKVTRWALGYSFLRLVWEIISLITGLKINGNEGVRILFIVLIVGFTSLLINDLREWQRQR